MSRRTDEEPISTLFVSGLPYDLKDRELKLLGTFLPGFEGATVNRPARSSSSSESKKDTLMGFMKFVTQEAALAAAQCLQNYVIDDDLPEASLRISLAKRNMNVGSRVSALKVAPPTYMFGNPYSPYGSIPLGTDYFGTATGSREADYDRSYYDRSIPGWSVGTDSVRDVRDGREAGSKELKEARVQGTVRGAACDTLCVRGLTQWTGDADIEAMFSKYEGYTDKLLFRNKGMAFVRFQDDRQALAVIQNIDQTTCQLPGAASDTSVSVEYAKRSLNLQKDK